MCKLGADGGTTCTTMPAYMAGLFHAGSTASVLECLTCDIPRLADNLHRPAKSSM